MSQRVQFSSFAASKPVSIYNRQPVRSSMPKSPCGKVSFSMNPESLKDVLGLGKEVVNMGLPPIGKKLPDIPIKEVTQIYEGILGKLPVSPECLQNQALMHLVNGQHNPELVLAMQRKRINTHAQNKFKKNFFSYESKY